ncbi:MAG: GYF domain-containing protein [Candidatus Fibromonas sp.]|jgi:chromosome segregation ATPase|nr:GYF domain-containing protein [Candidatus Fibromonas sp.]
MSEQKIWYMEINGQQQGPFSIDELLQRGLTGPSLVRAEGMADWLEAKDVPEMAEAFELIKMKNEIEIETFKFMADENADFRLQIERLEKSYEELLDEKSGIKAILKAMADKEAELSSQVGLLKDSNEELPNLKLSLTTELKALESENVELRSKLKTLFTKLVSGLQG